MSTVPHQSSIGEPAWEIARLFPDQGMWSEGDYLALNTNQLVEFVDGRIEILPMPTELHQLIVGFLYRLLFDFVESRDLGKVLFAPLRVKLWEGRFREPDVLFMSCENQGRRGNRFWLGADLTIEVVSDDDPDRDLVIKRGEYAKAGIREYWIVDPRAQTIQVLSLVATETDYKETGTFVTGQRAESVLLPGFSVDVSEVFSQA